MNREKIEEIKSKVDIVDYIGQFVDLKRAGSGFRGLSPWTKEKTPSFYVIPKKGIYKDFSSGNGGDVLDFASKHHNVGFMDAIKMMAERANVSIDMSEKEKEIHQKEVNIYTANKLLQNAFTKHANHNILGNRGINRDVQIEFGVGFCSKEIIKDENITADMMKTAGAYGGFKCIFEDRLTIPIHDKLGNPIGFGARKTKEDPNAPKYVNSYTSEVFDKQNTLFNYHRAKKDALLMNQVFLVEGYTDVMAMHQFDIKNVVCSMGTSITKGQVALLREMADTVILATDGDPAGYRALMRAMPLLMEAGLQIQIWSLEDGEDPMDFLMRSNKSLAVKDIRNFWEFWRSAREKLSAAEFVSQTSDMIATVGKIEDDLIRKVYFRELELILE